MINTIELPAMFMDLAECYQTQPIRPTEGSAAVGPEETLRVMRATGLEYHANAGSHSKKCPI